MAMLTAAERRTAFSPDPPSRPRLQPDLLTVPSHTSQPAAQAAMDQAAQAGNRTPARALLAATSTAGSPNRPPPGTTPDSIQLSTWDWEGGQHQGPRPPGTRPAAAARRR
jgi:hypothetical protein